MNCYDSEFLIREFSNKFRNGGKKLHSNDATTIIQRNSDFFQSIMETFVIMGKFPWNSNEENQVLYRYPSYDSESDSYIPFIFPKNKEIKSLAIKMDQLFDLFEPNDIKDVEYEVQYFPENNNSPYLFIGRILVCPLTLPIICHDFDLPFLLSQCKDNILPYAEICIVIKSKMPFHSLFFSLIKWFLQCDAVMRMKAFNEIESFISHGIIPDRSKTDGDSILSPAYYWPNASRTQFIEVITFIRSITPPKDEEIVIFDEKPFPLFKWQRCSSTKAYFPLARYCLQCLMDCISPDIIVILFSALCLEKSIIIYHPSSTVVSKCILSLHFMLRPLRWVFSSVSVLSQKLSDLLSSPTPFLAGAVFPIAEITSDMVYLDIENKKLKLGQSLPQFPYSNKLMLELKALWTDAKESKDNSLQDALQSFNICIRNMLSPCEASIISDISTQENTMSHFIIELYLGHFPQENRQYQEFFSKTQMFQLHIEQECRKRTDRYKTKNF